MKFFVAASCLVIVLAMSAGAYAGYVETLWEQATPPAIPKIVPVEADPQDTALLVLDIEQLTCNQERRPRCLQTVPRIAALIARARAAGMPVLYSLTSKGTPDTILKPVAPLKDEAIVQSSVNKFWQTDLDIFLKKLNTKSVIITGTAAHGAVLHTATAAAARGYGVILPVDCLSAREPYVEQAAIHLLETGPGTRKRIQLTESNLIVIPTNKKEKDCGNKRRKKSEGHRGTE